LGFSIVDSDSGITRTDGTLDCDYFRPLLPALALGALDTVDAGDVARHLLICASCRRELDSYADLVDAIGFAAPQFSPRPSLRDSILGGLTAPPPRMLRASWRWAAAAAAVLAILLAGNLALLLRGTVGEARAPVATRPSTVAAVPQLDWYDVTAAGPSAGSAYGILCAQETGSLAWLMVQDLPVLPPGKIYQAWLTNGDQRVSAGTFGVDPRGRGFLTIRLGQPIESYSGLGVTEEPSGGSTAPTGERLLGVTFD